MRPILKLTCWVPGTSPSTLERGAPEYLLLGHPEPLEVFPGFGVRVSGVGSRVWGFGYRISGFGFPAYRNIFSSLAPRRSRSSRGRHAAYSQVDMLGFWYKFVNLVPEDLLLGDPKAFEVLHREIYPPAVPRILPHVAQDVRQLHTIQSLTPTSVRFRTRCSCDVAQDARELHTTKRHVVSTARNGGACVIPTCPENTGIR